RGVLRHDSGLHRRRARRAHAAGHWRRRPEGSRHGRGRLSLERIGSGRRSHVSRFPACIMGTAVVPWTDSFELDEGLFRAEIASLLAADYTHLYVFGTAGEGYAVDDAQFEQIARVFVHEMRSGNAEAILGVILLSLPNMLWLIACLLDPVGAP